MRARSFEPRRSWINSNNRYWGRASFAPCRRYRSIKNSWVVGLCDQAAYWVSFCPMRVGESSPLITSTKHASQCGVVADGAGADLCFELDGQGQEAGQARHSACPGAWLATDRLKMEG